ncbi:WXG100 family type VII secretion target [Streptomyces sp. NBC_01142]|uniref:WXG100 family type VII secretion target n=1 Tax=Streptomyces sp. NBC_01142 TaxID=2975865 RepID=UPI002252E2B2|nr:WXG100 family type VII secretion target [Streptomyces sp. NBC_01142]MCX4819754.1 WXG100 family type VII secretion target [Streptomyces sp. NBC_01142]
MSGKDLKVTSSDIGELSGKIQAFQTNLSGRIGDLNRVVDLIQGGWKGAASQQYDVTQTELNRKLKNLQQSLENLENMVKMSADGFDAQERERMSSFTKMENAKGNSSAILDV